MAPRWAVFTWNDVFVQLSRLKQEVIAQDREGEDAISGGWTTGSNGAEHSVLMFVPTGSAMAKRWAGMGLVKVGEGVGHRGGDVE